MPSNIYLERNEDLSLYYLIKDAFASVTGLPIEDGFPTTNLSVPSIAIEAGKIRLQEFELGNREGLRYRKWYIEVFAKNKSQRDEFGYKILNELVNGFNVYDYNIGFPPDATPPIIEHMAVKSREMDIVRISPELVDKLYYRATISIVAVNDTV